MRDEHVRHILEGAPFAKLSEGELETVRAHAARCEECARAFEAARVSSLLLTERAEQVSEPSPFFQTRVLAALRERRAAEEAAPAWRRLWRAAGALVTSMAAVVLLLAGLTFVAPETPQQVASAADPYAPDAVLLGRGGAAEEGADFDQVLSTIYDAGDAGVDYGEER
jgi:hypothetical protein